MTVVVALKWWKHSGNIQYSCFCQFSYYFYVCVHVFLCFRRIVNSTLFFTHVQDIPYCTGYTVLHRIYRTVQDIPYCTGDTSLRWRHLSSIYRVLFSCLYLYLIRAMYMLCCTNPQFPLANLCRRVSESVFVLLSVQYALKIIKFTENSANNLM